MKSGLFAALLSVGLIACGSSAPKTRTVPGQSHVAQGETPDENSTQGGGDDVDAPLHGSSTAPAGGQETPGENPCAGETGTSTEVGTGETGEGGTSGASDAPVTFVLKNSGSDTLFLNMDKGWQAVIFAYSGKPPNAKSVLMFPTHCTAACDAPADEICPYCPEPKQVAAIKAAEKHEPVEPGQSKSVSWDGMRFVYKKARGKSNGKSARCKCYETSETPAETYTIKACGLRKTQSAKKRSQYQCVEGTLKWPVTEATTVELNFD